MSKQNARPCNVEWIRSLVAQGKAAEVSVFVKQLGAVACEPAGLSDQLVKLPFQHKKGGDQSEWTTDLRVREWPSNR